MESYLLQRKLPVSEVEFGSFTKSVVLTKKELLNYLHKIQRQLPVGEVLPADWEIVTYSLLEIRASDASEFLIKKTKSPLVKE